jgi:hypothetical protein
MAQAIGQFSGADQPEDELFTFDFVNDLPLGDTITDAVWAISVAVGVDPTVDDRAVGDPTVFGTRVTQQAAGFLPGVRYVMACLITTAMGSTLELWAYLDGETVGC